MRTLTAFPCTFFLWLPSYTARSLANCSDLVHNEKAQKFDSKEYLQVGLVGTSSDWCFVGFPKDANLILLRDVQSVMCWNQRHSVCDSCVATAWIKATTVGPLDTYMKE